MFEREKKMTVTEFDIFSNESSLKIFIILNIVFNISTSSHLAY